MSIAAEEPIEGDMDSDMGTPVGEEDEEDFYEMYKTKDGGSEDDDQSDTSSVDIVGDAMDLLENKKSDTVINGLRMMDKALLTEKYLPSCLERPSSILFELMGVVKRDKTPQSLIALNSVTKVVCQIGKYCDSLQSDCLSEVTKLVRNAGTMERRVFAARCMAAIIFVDDVEDELVVEYVKEVAKLLKQLKHSQADLFVMLTESLSIVLPFVPPQQRSSDLLQPLFLSLIDGLTSSSVEAKVAAGKCGLVLASTIGKQAEFGGYIKTLTQSISDLAKEAPRNVNQRDRRRQKKEFSFLEQHMRSQPSREVHINLGRTSYLDLTLSSWTDVAVYEFFVRTLRNGMRCHLAMKDNALSLYFKNRIARSTESDTADERSLNRVNKKYRSYDSDRKQKELEKHAYMAGDITE